MVPTVSIVVVHYQGEARLARCIDSLDRDLRRGEALGVAPTADASAVELIVVENGPQAEPGSTVLETWPDLVRVRSSRNLGFAAGANAGLARATGEWVAVLNDDVEVVPGFHAAMARAAARVPARCGMLQPCVVRDDDPTRVDTTGVAIGAGASIVDRDRDRETFRASGPGEVFCASAGAAWYRRSMLREVAPDGRCFDPDYFMYFEDVDLGWRCRLAGWSAEYVPDAIVRHERHASAASHGADFVRRQCMRNRLRVVLANGTPRYVARALPRLARDAGGLLAGGGADGAREIVRSIAGGLARRRGLSEEARRARRAVERDWLGAP